MNYRRLTPNGPELSLLGYGCMRFPTTAGRVDKDLTFSQLHAAYESGVNYFDTAYIYHGGQSEVVLGEFLKKYDLRDKVYIADKLPGYLASKQEHIEKYFNTQLERLKTSKIDFYLMHTLDSMAAWKKLKNLGIDDFIEAKKAAGQIGYIGFSYHGRPEGFVEILEDYPWDFCQIQFNYLDENYQAGLVGLERAGQLGIGVIVMEPLRGGSLAAKAPDRVREIFAAAKTAEGKTESSAFWGLRWVMDHPQVGVVLSGMNDFAHIEENVRVASASHPETMTDSEKAVIAQVKEVYGELMKVPCTGCNYCMPCPFGVDIPAIFSNYNDKYFFAKKSGASVNYMSRAAGLVSGVKSGANLCTGCGKCAKHCPQSIKIPEMLKEAHKDLSRPYIQFFINVGAKFMALRRRRVTKKCKVEK